jgi:xylulokinase
LQAVCRQLSRQLEGISAVGLATHCPAVIPLDALGSPVGAALTWDDPSLAGYLAAVASRRSPRMLAATGNHPAPSTTMALAHHYFRDHDPTAFAALRWLGFVGTWLGAQLTGIVATDPTQASYSGVYDVVGPLGGWLPEAAEELAITGSTLPPVRSPLDVLGATTTPFAISLGLPAGVPVVVGSADTPATAHALGYAPLLSLGTTHVVSGERSSPDRRSRVLQRCGIRAGQWLVNGVFNGGTALSAAAALAGLSGTGGVGELVRRGAGINPGCRPDDLVFIPHVAAERGPLWLDRPAAGFLGLSTATTHEQLAAAVVDGVAFADRLVLEATLAPSDDPVFLTGAFSDDLALPQRIADLTGRCFRVLTEPDLPAIGVAMMAAEAVAGAATPFRPATSLLEPGGDRAGVDQAWSAFLDAWALVTGVDPMSILSRVPTDPAPTPAERPTT